MPRILYFQSDRPQAAFAEACLALTPRVSLYAHREDFCEIFLDIAPTQKVFGGEARVLFHADRIAQSFGWPRSTQDRQVLTDRPEWARALARRKSVLLPPGKSQAALHQLPIGYLADCGDPAVIEDEAKERAALAAFLRKVGVTTIGDFVRLDAGSIGARFGELGVRLHACASGRQTLALPVFSPEEPIAETLDTEDIADRETLALLLRDRLPRIEARLQARALAVRKLTLRFRMEGARSFARDLQLTEPLQEAHAIFKTLRDFLESITWDAGLLETRLEVSDTVPFLPGQLHLFDESENRFHDLAQYVGRLRARYGQEAVGVAELTESYLPERSWNLIWPPGTQVPRAPRRENRPLFFFVPPRPCSPPTRWKSGVSGGTSGPLRWKLTPTENLAAEWWEPGGSRQYFIAENPGGERLWVYFDREKDGWFLHGTFD